MKKTVFHYAVIGITLFILLPMAFRYAWKKAGMPNPNQETYTAHR